MKREVLITDEIPYFDKDKIYFTADLHFGHGNFLFKYNIRDFKSVEEMDETMISRWNEIVPDDGIVFCLGDFSFHDDPNKTLDIIDRLNGSIYYIQGNHEKRISQFHYPFEEVMGLKDILVLDSDAPKFLGKRQRLIALCHYCLETWNKSHKGTWALFGHSHGDLTYNPGQENYDKSLKFDIGVDCWDFRPLSYYDIVRVMTNKACYGKQNNHGNKAKN